METNKTRGRESKTNWNDIAQAIRDSVTMEDMLSAYAPSTPRRNHRCPCPIHNGDDFNFSYNDTWYKCFVCGASGDAISFVKEICNLQSMSDAMKKINADFKLNLPIGCDPSPEQSAEIAIKRAEREDKRRREEAWWNEYHLIYDEWIRLDKAKRTADPESDEYIYAVKNIDRVSYMLDQIMDSKDNSEAIEAPKPEVVFTADGVDKNGNPKLLISNFVTIMQSDSRYAGIRFNELSSRAEIHTTVNGKLNIAPWTDADEARSMNYIEQNYGIYSKDKHTAALRILFDERKYNPIIDIVDNIEWDGQNRCEHFLAEWAKVEDNDYTREVSRLIFAGGIHRLYAPGTKFDDVPILIGTEQGEGKSTLIRYLAINDSYYGEITAVEGQPAIEQLQGKWICEISELLALTKNKDQEAVKAYITRAVDSYRKPWDKNVSEFPRRCIFLGTSNDSNPLVDKTGNRRYYPVEVHSNGYDVYAHEGEIREYILQCWAEARERYKQHKMPNYANQKLVGLYREAQENAMQDDWRVGAIRAYLDRKSPGELTCVREVCHRALSTNPDFPKEPTLAESKDLGRILNKLKDWERCASPRHCGAYGTQRCWKKKGEQIIDKPDKPFWE